MVNKNLFSTLAARFLPWATTQNAAGGIAFERSEEQALAQLAVTGCLNGTYYTEAEAHLGNALRFAQTVEPEFLANCAIYARRFGRMKDMPALLLAVLAQRDAARFECTFDEVIDDARQLRAFVQIVRSGAVGRRNLGSRTKRLIRRWLAARTEEQLFRYALGNSPSLADIVKMVHPLPATPQRRAFYGWLIGREHDASQLPPIVREYEAWRAAPDAAKELPKVPFLYLANENLDVRSWTELAKTASWQSLRMNLNRFERHGVFADADACAAIAARLRDVDLIRRSRAFPYQILATFKNASASLPGSIREGLHDALEIATQNAPVLPGRVVVAIDVSGSMGHSITGTRQGATSKVRCVDVAGLFAATIVRRNPDARVIVFNDRAEYLELEPRDTVLTNTKRISDRLGGGTKVSSAVELIERSVAQHGVPNTVVIFSDNESWLEPNRSGTTETLARWEALRRRNRHAKLALVDLTPNPTTQALERTDVMNIGGFSDDVFVLLEEFAKPGNAAQRLVERIRSVRDLQPTMSPESVE